MYNCNNIYQSIQLEHGSKLWLNECIVQNSIGAAIHVNTGCKCLLTVSILSQCGRSNASVPPGQGAVVIYGTEINYVEHLVLYLCLIYSQLSSLYIDCLYK